MCHLAPLFVINKSISTVTITCIFWGNCHLMRYITDVSFQTSLVRSVHIKMIHYNRFEFRHVCKFELQNAKSTTCHGRNCTNIQNKITGNSGRFLVVDGSWAENFQNLQFLCRSTVFFIPLHLEVILFFIVLGIIDTARFKKIML